MPRFLRPLAAILVALFISGCAGGESHYRYRYIPGKTGTVRWDGEAVIPYSAPRQVHAMVEAANRINGFPYLMGGGHGTAIAAAYDCSGATSYVLRAGGVMQGSMTSRSFRNFGAPGKGEWVSIYARENHVFLVVAGLRFDTGWTNQPEGPRWTMMSRPLKGTVVRHIPGL